MCCLFGYEICAMIFSAKNFNMIERGLLWCMPPKNSTYYRTRRPQRKRIFLRAVVLDGVGPQANIDEEYVLLSALLRFFFRLKRA